MIERGFLGAAIGIVFVLGIQTGLVRAARKIASNRRVVGFMDPIVTTEDEKYSLSRFQMYLWTVLVLIGFSAVAFAKLEFPNIPQNLYILMGINLAAAVTSTAIHTVKTQPISTSVSTMPALNSLPNFVSDIFFESGNKASVDLPRTQIFLWTIVIAIIFVSMVINGFVVSSPSLPDVPSGLLALMGISNGAYLGAKAVVRGT